MTDTTTGSATDTAKDVGNTAKESGSEVAGHAADQAKDVAGHATDQAKDVAGHATDQAKDVAGHATEQAKQVAGTATDQVRDLVGQAQTRLHEEAGTQSENAVAGLRALSDELRSMSRHDGDQGVATDLAGRGQGYAQQAADYLDGKAPGELFDDLRSFARRRPGAFLAGALVAGVVAGRLTRGVTAVAKQDDTPDTTAVSAPAASVDVPVTGYEGNGRYAVDDRPIATSDVSAQDVVGYGTGPVLGEPDDGASPYRHASEL